MSRIQAALRGFLGPILGPIILAALQMHDERQTARWNTELNTNKQSSTR